MQLAEINVARLKHDQDDPRVADFMNNLDRINGIAERSEGFVWRHIDETGNATATRTDPDPRLISNVSTWKTVPDFERFVWGTIHKQFYQRREEWFDALDSMHFAMWWLQDGHRPSMAEATDRLADLNKNGPSERVFGWAELPEATLWRTAQCGEVAAE
ncbi:DUF3291 domain-containing protein [Litoreibacter roseus]|uniref:DUF3291 domain-containing protein n=1 Tax=Litoreibacter roseus TaxID=2601869 RepID=A0A6N6JDW9_9RHOB|nr:DUF3291 domain-containing protein [Litoreibacter roseus]GFE64334.1 hypothetical protein KIN_14080 [Litoreibacter roseus]